MLCVPLAWAQPLRPTLVSIEPSNDAIPAGGFQAEKPLFASYGKAPLNLPTNLNPTQSGSTAVSGSSNRLLVPTIRSIRELAGGPKNLIPGTPKEWLTIPSSEVDDQTLYTHDLKYYGSRTPLVGPAILRIAQQADAHPRITRVLLMIDPQF